jgi:hypothetical protein
MPLTLVIVIVVEHILHDPYLISQSSVIVVPQTVWVTFSTRCQKHGRIRGNGWACEDAAPWRYCPLLGKRKQKCRLLVPFLNRRAHNLLHGGVCSSSGMCTSICKEVYCIVWWDMSHWHKVDRWIMVLTTKQASYIIVLGIVISVLPLSSTLVVTAGWNAITVRQSIQYSMW